MEQGLRMFREKGGKSKLVKLHCEPWWLASFIYSNLKYVSQNMFKINSIYQNFGNFPSNKYCVSLPERCVLMCENLTVWCWLVFTMKKINGQFTLCDLGGFVGSSSLLWSDPWPQYVKVGRPLVARINLVTDSLLFAGGCCITLGFHSQCERQEIVRKGQLTFSIKFANC